MTREDINNKKFRVSFRGYNISDVDGFMDRVADEITEMQLRIIGLEDELKAEKERNRNGRNYQPAGW